MTRYGLAREVATLKTQLATLGQRALPSWEAAQQAHAQAVQRRACARLDELLDDGLPRRYAALVAAEVRDAPAAWSPLTARCWAIARWTAAAEFGANACPFPLRVTEPDCQLLVTEPPGSLVWHQAPACERCGYIVPSRAGLAGSVAAPWTFTPEGVPCSHCGGVAVWRDGNIWWRGEGQDCWRWDPRTGTVSPMAAPYPARVGD